MNIKKEFKETLSLAVPMVFSQILGYAQAIIDTVMAGRHSNLTLAGVALATQVFSIIYVLFGGVAIAFAAQFSRYRGADNRLEMRRDFQQGIWLFLGLGFLTIILTYLAAFLPSLLGSKPEIASEAQKYLWIVAIPSGIFIFAELAIGFFQGMAFPRIINIAMCLALPLNALGNYLTLYVFNLGVAGMALSTGICHTILAFALFYILFKSPRFKIYHLFQKIQKPDLTAIKRLFNKGITIGIAIVLEVGLFNFVGIMASRENAIVASANQIAVNYISIIFMIPLGIASALTIRVAEARGKRDKNLIRDRAYMGMALSLIFMSFAALITLIFKAKIVSFYSTDLEISRLSQQILLIGACFQILDGLQISATGVLRGLADTKIAMIFAIKGYWIIGMPTGLIFAYLFNFGFIGLWFGIAIGLASFATMAVMRVRRRVKN